MSTKVKGKKPDISSEDLKDQILEVARRHFALYGYHGTSLKNIAEDAKVANSLINYHFKDKAGLLEECMKPFAVKQVETIERILGEPRNPDDLKVRLELFVEEMLSSVRTNYHMHLIIDREAACGNPAILKIFESTLLKSFQATVDFFKSAQKNGLIGEELDPMIVAALLYTSTSDAGRKDLLAKTFYDVSLEQPEWRKKFSQHVVTLFLSGVMK